MGPGHVFPERLTCGAQLAAQLTLRSGRGHVPGLDVIHHVPVVGAGVAALAAPVGAGHIQNYLGLDNLIQGPGVFLEKIKVLVKLPFSCEAQLNKCTFLSVRLQN